MRNDPIGIEGGINLYTFVGNNSTNVIDPLGLVGKFVSPLEHIESLILTGRIGQAIEYAKIVGGAGAARLLQQAQRLQNTINSLINRYPIGSGKCDELAKGIYEAFKNAGGSPQVMQITPNGAARRIIVDGVSYFEHYAIRIGDKIYDAYTKGSGMAVEQYLQRLDGFNLGRNSYSYVEITYKELLKKLCCGG